ncbi:pilus assembly protein [Oscillochloris sp. ZM17-4]|uniref:TadE family protein n=1 Tax=Oscillochloris sp. ZM17-4 TaxID=2866714 RepID=UPI001C736E5A|nr:TadE family protein [Oscillochloris sp. ZM17-4]MBX0327616.1 pilus assembly protein [Oscillochloris sp. ZM17-4]
MFRRSSAKRTVGQALVEFALAATLIFMLLSAAVDLGLIFFTLQGLRTAAQEGATFGSHPVLVMNGSSVQAVDLDYNEIVNRVRFSGGDNPTGFANLLDLNNDGVDDGGQTVINYWNPNANIYIQLLKYSGDNILGTPTTCRTTTAGVDMRNTGKYCYVRVTVKYTYKFIFPLAPAFADSIELRTSYMMRIRSSFRG